MPFFNVPFTCEGTASIEADSKEEARDRVMDIIIGLEEDTERVWFEVQSVDVKEDDPMFFETKTR